MAARMGVPWRQEAVEFVARVIHDEGGGCCEWGYGGCANQQAAREAAVVALAAWYGTTLLLVESQP